MKDFLKNVLATITGIIVLGIIMAIISVISMVGLVASSAGNTKVAENSVFTLMLSGQLDERAADNPLSMLTGQVSDNLGLDDIVSAIKKAKNNKDIKGIYIEAGIFSSDTPASSHAIREALLDFKKSGKWIVAYSDSYTQSTYYICSVADKLYLNPQGMVDWHGLASNPYFVKDLLAKFGVKYQLCKVGKYKSAPEMMTADKMSEPNREQVTAYLTGIWKVMLKDVSDSRKIPVDSLNAYADRFVALAEQSELVKMKLVDKLIYTDEVKSEIKQLLKLDKDADIPQLTLADMKNVKGDKQDGDQVAVYYAYGEIDDDRTSGFNQEHCITSKEMTKDLQKLANDKDVKAVVIRVNSPGGSAYASEQIWHEIELLKAKKPVVISMGGLAASGGYYISCGANKIFAEPTTLTGSIGIFGMIPDVSELMTKKLGLTFDVVKTNALSDFGAFGRPFNETECRLMQAYVNKGYDLFTGRVAKGRGMAQDSVKAIAEGRVWTGEQALKIGLVDKLGNLDDAIKAAAKIAKVEKYTIGKYPDAQPWYVGLLDKNTNDYLEGHIRALLGDEYYKAFGLIRNLKNQDPIQARIPFDPNIK